MPENSYDTLIEFLNRGEELRFEEAKTLLGLGERQIKRLIERARHEGYDIVERRDEDRRKVFSIPEGSREAGFRVSLTEHELLALTIAADAARATLGTTSLAEPIRSAVAKLIDKFPDEVVPLELDDAAMAWHFSSNPVAEVDPGIFAQLVEAIRNEQEIEIDYYSASRAQRTPNRRLDPYALALRGSSWLLVAWCHERHAFRDFSIPAIRSVRTTGRYIYRRDDFDLDEHFAGRFGSLGGKALRIVRLRVEPDRVPYFRRKTYHPSQQLSEHDDGSATVEYKVAGLDDMRSFAQSWGSGVTVLEPEELVETLRNEARMVAERYDAAHGGNATDTTR